MVVQRISGYCNSVHRPGTIYLYRYWKSHRSDHFYTANILEIRTTIYLENLVTMDTRVRVSHVGFSLHMKHSYISVYDRF